MIRLFSEIAFHDYNGWQSFSHPLKLLQYLLQVYCNHKEFVLVIFFFLLDSTKHVLSKNIKKHHVMRINLQIIIYTHFHLPPSPYSSNRQLTLHVSL
jgi:hypothetical protein